MLLLSSPIVDYLLTILDVISVVVAAAVPVVVVAFTNF